MLDASVAEVISKLVSNPKFSDLIRNKINMEVDTSASVSYTHLYNKGVG